MQEQQPEPRVLPPRMTEGVQELTELRRDGTPTPEPRVPTAFEQSLRQFMGQENIGVNALAKRLGKSQGSVSEWLTGKTVCSTQAEVLHKLGLGPPPQELPTPAPRVPTAFEQSLRQFMGQENIGVNALAKRLGKSQGSVSEWLTGKTVCSTQAEVLHKLGLGPPPQELPTPAPRVPTAFEQSLRQFMRQENIGANALAKRLGKSQGSVSEWLSGNKVCSTQAEVLHKLGLGPPPLAEPPKRKRRKQLQGLNRAIRIIRKATKRPVIIQLRPIKAEPAS